MNRTVLAIVLIFLLCQTPYHVVELISLEKVRKAERVNLGGAGERYYPSPTELKVFVYLNVIAQILVFVSSCCNPIIYGLMNDNYSKCISIFIFT